MKTLRPWWLVLALAVSVTAVGCVVNPATGERQVRVISTAEEIAIGEQAAPKFEAEFGGRVPVPALQRYIRQVGGSVGRVSERQEVPRQYALLASMVPNAFALPGGKVYITAGLMLQLTNERQLAAVLGHETGHVAAAHNVMALQRQMGAALLAELAAAAVGGKGAGGAKLATRLATALANLHYSREDEYEADQLGIRYMTRAGYNPWGMVELLKRLLAMSRSEPGRVGEMFQTHPITSKRIRRAEGTIRRRYRQFSPDRPDPHAGRFVEMRVLLERYLKRRS